MIPSSSSDARLFTRSTLGHCLLFTKRCRPLQLQRFRVQQPRFRHLASALTISATFMTCILALQIKRVGARVKDLASDVGDLMQSLQV